MALTLAVDRRGAGFGVAGGFAIGAKLGRAKVDRLLSFRDGDI